MPRTYTCKFCGRRETVFPLLDFGDGLRDMEMLGWDISRGVCDLCIADDARARDREERNFDTPIGEEMGG